ncbi:MAG: pseudouridine synthase [Desulfobacterales bacterium]|nr:MAG: pseudouridine synthase [Desulfobacterales bacterium]
MEILITIAEKLVGLRLDQALSASVEGLSRRRAADLAAAGEVLVNGDKKRPGYKVKNAEVITGDIQDVPALPQPEKMALSILYEDDFIVVIDKPPGQVVHPASGNMSGTLVNGLLAHDSVFLDAAWDPLRPGIVHRLDKDTSGVIVVAKTLRSLAFLQNEFKQRRVAKYYLALVQGHHIPESGDIERPIGRHPKYRKMMSVVSNGGKYARTKFKVRQRFDTGALVDVFLFTGRTHQIRVHFYHEGMPLFGETVYQFRRHRKQPTLMAPRQMLHARQISFRHPYSGRLMTFEAPIPKDFMNIIARLDVPHTPRKK